MSQVIRLSASGVIPPGTYVQTLTGDSGGAVGPDGADNINIIANNATVNAGSTVLLVGTPINNTLTLNVSDISSNTLLGRNAGNLTTSGSSNTGVGTGVLSAITSGSGNTAVGVDALNLATTGSANVAIGFEAGINVTGLNNTIVGYAALSTASAANSNTVIGYQAMANSTAGANNIVLGVSAASAFTGSEGNNIIIGNTGTLADTNTIRIGTQGAGVGQQNRNFQAGINGVTVGSPRPVVIDSVTNQLGVDSGTGSVLTLTGDVGPAVSPTVNNINVVSGRLTNNAGGTVFFEGSGSTLTLEMSDSVLNNTFVGYLAGNTTTTGNSNTALGVNSGQDLTSGSANTFLGFNAGANTTTASNNTSVGFDALRDNTTGTRATAVGTGALRFSTANNNTAVGAGALQEVSGAGGFGNTAVGAMALASLNTGQNNIAVGNNSLGGNFNGSYNINVVGGLTNPFTGSESNNILLNHEGVLGVSNRLIIGRATGTGNYELSTAFIHGINGNTVANTRMVTIDSVTSQLGTAAVPSGGTVWSVITTSQTAVVNNGYFINSVGSMNLALPAASAVGDVIEAIVVSSGSTLNITQAAGQQIFFGNTSTTLGAGGSLQNTSIGDAIKLVCRTANTVWYVASGPQGNWTVI